MKSKKASLIAIALAVGSFLLNGTPSRANSVTTDSDTNPKLVTMAAQSIFAPPGFDDNDNVQIVIEVYLPNTCYKSAPPLVRVDQATRQIFITPQAYQYAGTLCLELWTPYTRVIDLGVLSHGSYDVLSVDKQGASTHRAVLPIAVATTSNPDDYLYAPIKQATIDRSSGKAVLELSGVFSGDCIKLQEVRVMNRVPHIIEVLPISEYTSETCHATSVPFDSKVELPAMGDGATLIYIRSLNGQSVSLVEDL